jgi:AcrR family transcriptional regulator
MELSKRSLKKIEQIKEASLLLFKSQGLNKVTMEEIAKKAAVSKVTLYKYFPDKQTLYETLVRDIYDTERREMRDIQAMDANFHEKMNAIIEVRVNKYYEQLQKFFEDYFVRSEELNTYMIEFIEEVKNIRKDIYAQGRREGLIGNEYEDATIDQYFEVIQSGLAANYHDLSVLERDKLTNLLRLVYTGIVDKSK